MATFGPSGTVWSSTVVRIPVQDRQPPYVVAYVDIDDGPRVLAGVAALTDMAAPRPGSRVRLVEPTGGDLMVEVLP